MDPEKCSLIALHLTIVLMLDYFISSEDKVYLAVKICKHVNNIKLQFLKTEMFIIAKLADLENVMEKYWGLERVNWAMCSPVLLLTGFRILARSLTPEHFHL